MQQRVYNFSAGPAVLPEPVLAEAQRDLFALPSVGSSILEISHRSGDFQAVMSAAGEHLRRLLAIPENYEVLFLQGGSRLQFSMVPLNLLQGPNRSADYILTGSWGQKAIEEARREAPMRVAWDGKPTEFQRVPTNAELDLDQDASYVHFTSNETIQGVQFSAEPEVGSVPLICDASSDFLSRPLPLDRYGLIYACAQKNAGPAGVTIVIIREDLLERSDPALHGMLSYRNHAEQQSLYNTPCTFGIYIVNLVAKWLLDEFGSLEKMAHHNQKKAALLYEVIDASDGFYRGHADPSCRSLMNVTFRLPNDELEQKFLANAAEQRLRSLKGHRSVGGIRASIYNAMPMAGVESLRDFMIEFRQRFEHA